MIDPVTLEVIRNSLPAIANEMAQALQRTSYNMMIYEVRDFSCAILDEQGRLLSQNLGGVSHFVSDMDVVIRDALDRIGRDGFRPGDGYLMNHERVCGQHLNNMVTYMPIFTEGGLFGFTVVRAHWVDVGGLSTGFGPEKGARIDPWQEGLQIDQLRIMEGDQFDDRLVRLIADNIRYPESSLGDMRAQFAACRVGAQRVQDLVTRYGRPDVEQGILRIWKAAEERCRQVVAAIPDGEYVGESLLDNDFLKLDEPLNIVAKVRVSGSDMCIDLTGCARQRESTINARTRAAAYIAYKGLTTPLEPLNEGSFAALQVVLDEGNFMMARYPCSMANWSAALPTVVDTVLRALADAVPDRVPAAHFGTLSGMVFFGSRRDSGQRFVGATAEGGGWGGRPFGDGASASVTNCQGDVRNAPIEALELKYPVLVESRRLRKDSAGAGRFRGGLGLVTEIRNLVDGTWKLPASARDLCPAWGVSGGMPATPGNFEIRDVPEGEWHRPDQERCFVPAGGAARALTGGGGGWGSPADRDYDAIDDDLRDEYLSPEAVRRDYCVVVDAATGIVDRAASDRLRARRDDRPGRDRGLGDQRDADSVTLTARAEELVRE